MGFSALKFSVVALVADLIFAIPMWVVGHTNLIGDVDRAYELSQVFSRFWAATHYPMEMVITGFLFSGNVHENTPLWKDFAYYGACFTQTFTFCWVAAKLAILLKRCI